VNGGTKLQEVPEIKNCIIGAAPNSLKRKRGGISEGKKYARKVGKPALLQAYLPQAGRKENHCFAA
jgi:hypothetical protein